MTSIPKLPSEEIQELSDEELERYADSAKDGTSGKRLALEELNRRRLRSRARAHWILTARFCIAVVVIALAGCVAVLLARQYQADPSAGSSARSLQLRSQSVPSE